MTIEITLTVNRAHLALAASKLNPKAIRVGPRQARELVSGGSWTPTRLSSGEIKLFGLPLYIDNDFDGIAIVGDDDEVFSIPMGDTP